MSLPLLLAILILVAIYFWLNRHTLQLGGRSKASGLKPVLSGGVRGATRRQLLRLVGGNQDVAQRLVDTVKGRYPGRSEQWCWEKAIYDIQRDRRS